MVRNQSTHYISLVKSVLSAGVFVLLMLSAAAFASDTVPADVEKAWHLLRSSQKDKCLALAQKALKANPKSADWHELMVMAVPLTRGDLVMEHLNKAMSLKPSSARIMTTGALINLDYANTSLAFDLASKALNLDVKNGRACAVLGACYHRMARGADATNQFAKALKLSKSDYDVNVLASEYYTKILDETDAMACANRLVATYPASSDVYVLRARLRRGGNDAPGSLSDLDHALTLDPRDTYALELKGNLLQGLHRYKEAARAYTQFLAICPENFGVRCRRAKSWQDDGQLAKAIDDYSMSIKQAAGNKADAHFIAPKDPLFPAKMYKDCWIKRMQLLERTGQTEKALADANEILRVDKLCGSALELRQGMLQKKGRYQEAIQDLNKLVQLDDDVSAWYTARGEAYKKLNRPQQAAADFARAKHIDEFGN